MYGLLTFVVRLPVTCVAYVATSLCDPHATNCADRRLEWFVVNIPDGDVSKGQQVLPFQATRGGVGPQRHVLLLFIQPKALTVLGSLAIRALELGAPVPTDTPTHMPIVTPTDS